jgi:pimeloyl-ACP methyl ester carboxylesterase
LSEPVAQASREIVVVTHGLWVTGRIMAWLAGQLNEAGFDARCFSYPSVNASLSANAARLARFVAALPGERVNFLGHSLGGLLILQMLHEQFEERTDHVVLLGTPYSDCRSARNLSLWSIGSRLTGHSMRQWLLQDKPPLKARTEVGVIAGSRSFGLGRLIPGLPRPNDGAVAVCETHVPGMRDHVVLHVSHTEMLFSRSVAEAAIAFLRLGHFSRP